MNEVVSIIVPIFNVEPYLRRCVDSIIKQTYPHLDIILVDDGSPDGCGKICDEYAEKDSRIRVIHKRNGGLSDARNAGLGCMNGDYVAFIDSDDWIDRDWVEVLLGNMLEQHAQMSLSGIVREFESEKESSSVLITGDYGNEPFSESNVDMMRRFFRTSWVAWDKIYQAELFKEIRFPVGEINEDEAIVMQLLDRCRRVAITNQTYYHYLERRNSITTSAFSPKKLDWIKHCKDNLKFVQNHYPELEMDAAARYRGSILWALREIALSEGQNAHLVLSLNDDLKKNKKIFRKAPFSNRKDRIRFELLTLLPFALYRYLLRIRHGM